MNKIMKNIVLIGMPGCGKSTIGRMVAKKLGLGFCDLDEYIEQREGKIIPEIFKDGEECFRQIEKASVAEVVKTCPSVIATGGGVVLNSCNIDVLKENGIIFFINRPVEQIVSGVDISNRPLLKKGREQVYKLYNERIGLYKKCCDFEIENHGCIENAVDKIIKILS
jgi:Shikimate kinase